MKLIHKTVSIIAMALLLTACAESETKQENNVTTTISSNEIEQLDYAVEGMVCAMGCAATIQKEVADMEGVVVSDVDYEEEKAHFEFDPAVTSEQAIKEKIATLADGQYVLTEWEEQESTATETTEETEENATEKKEDDMVKVELPNVEIPNLLALLLNQL